MSAKAPSINLLQNKEKKLYDKVMNWALTMGRIVIILTEGIALSAFLYRFSLDRQLIDLHDEISRKQAIVKFYKLNEEKYRNLQQRLALASQFTKSQNEMTRIFTDTSMLTPAEVTISNLIITKEQLKIEARARSTTALSTFITNLQKYPKISSLSLDRIENKTSSATVGVSITARLHN